MNTTVKVSHSNPYRDGGSYHKLFAYIMKRAGRKATVTLAEMREVAKTVKATEFDVTVVMSPRKESKIGDPRGNMSAAGRDYYMEKLERRVLKDVKEPQRFRLQWRDEASVKAIEQKYGARARDKKIEVAAVKATATTDVKVEQKATVKA